MPLGPGRSKHDEANAGLNMNFDICFTTFSVRCPVYIFLSSSFHVYLSQNAQNITNWKQFYTRALNLKPQGSPNLVLVLISFHTGPDVSCVSVQMTLVSNIESYRDYHNIG